MKEEIMATQKNILVPTDFTEYSDKALTEAIRVAAQYDAKIYLLHVIDSQPYQAGAEDLSEYVIKETEARELSELKEARAMIEKQINHLGKEKNVDIISDIKTGSPADVILDEQRAKAIDLIVIGSHGKKGFLRGLVGSITYSVVKNAPCSVMVVRR